MLQFVIAVYLSVLSASRKEFIDARERNRKWFVVGLKCVRPILWALNLIDQKHKKKSGVVDIDR